LGAGIDIAFGHESIEGFGDLFVQRRWFFP